MVELEDWNGLIKDRNDDFNDLRMTALLATGGNSFARPFLAVADDGRSYWVKCIDTCPQHSKMSVAIKHIVSNVGRLINAPVCESNLIRIPEELAGWPLGKGHLQAGLAHASLALSKVIERRPALASHTRDDNPACQHRGQSVTAIWRRSAGSLNTGRHLSPVVSEHWLEGRLSPDESLYLLDHQMSP